MTESDRSVPVPRSPQGVEVTQLLKICLEQGNGPSSRAALLLSNVIPGFAKQKPRDPQKTWFPAPRALRTTGMTVLLLFPPLFAADLTPEGVEAGFEIMLTARMEVEGIEPAPVAYERLCTAVEALQEQHKAVTSQRSTREKEFMDCVAQVRDLERARREGVRGEADGEIAGQIKTLMAQQEVREASVQEAVAHEALLAKQLDDLQEECAYAERNVEILEVCAEKSVDKEQLASLLLVGADPNACDEDGYTAMLHALDGDDYAAFYQLRDAGGTYLEPLDAELQKEFDEDVCLACDKPELESAELLWSLYMGGRLPADALPRALQSAATNDIAFARVRLLCKEKVVMNERDAHGQTALHYAVLRWLGAGDDAERECMHKMVKLLIVQGADPDVLNSNGKSARDYAGDEEL